MIGAIVFLISSIISLVTLGYMYKEGMIPKISSRKDKDKTKSKGSEIAEKIEKAMEKTSDKEKELLEQRAEMLKERALQEQERAKKLEEKYDELRMEYETAKNELKKKDEEIKKRDELTKKIEEESKKLARFSTKRYKKGHYVPVILWTKRGNPLPYKFVVEIGWVNGGWRALLVDSITADPNTGEWFPDLNKPAPNFLFRDDPGFQPDNPEHSVLFDINKYEWEEDLKISRGDPESKPVAFSFGIDIEGNPIHRLQYGSGLHINTLRAENRKLKLEVMRYMHMLRETEAKLSDYEYRWRMERDLREHMEKELKLLRAQLYETRDIIYLMGDELETAREAWRTQSLRKQSAMRRAEEAEKMFDAYFGRPQIVETSITPYLEQKSKEKNAMIVSLLAPIARMEASTYGINKAGKSDEEIVDEWIKTKIEREGYKGFINTLKELGIDMDITNIIKQGMI